MPLDPLTGLYPEAPAPTLVKETKYVYQALPPIPKELATISQGVGDGQDGFSISLYYDENNKARILKYVPFLGFVWYYL